MVSPLPAFTTASWVLHNFHAFRLVPVADHSLEQIPLLIVCRILGAVVGAWALMDPFCRRRLLHPCGTLWLGPPCPIGGTCGTDPAWWLGHLHFRLHRYGDHS